MTEKNPLTDISCQFGCPVAETYEEHGVRWTLTVVRSRGELLPADDELT